jgi:hypothetical protein
MILSDQICDDYSPDDGTESNKNYVEPREGMQKMLYQIIIAALK